MTVASRLDRIEKVVKTTGTSLLDRLAGIGYDEIIRLDSLYYKLGGYTPLTPELKELQDDLTKLNNKDQTEILNQLKGLKGWDKLPVWIDQLTGKMTLEIDKELLNE